ncbi:hypothetical protein BD560DRAFT_465487 [Blakeslea trispora]|nr:hypothetical protein BD560DRAFT_465487 [Blakeslea trispora]
MTANTKEKPSSIKLKLEAHIKAMYSRQPKELVLEQISLFSFLGSSSLIDIVVLQRLFLKLNNQQYRIKRGYHGGARCLFESPVFCKILKTKKENGGALVQEVILIILIIVVETSCLGLNCILKNSSSSPSVMTFEYISKESKEITKGSTRFLQKAAFTSKENSWVVCISLLLVHYIFFSAKLMLLHVMLPVDILNKVLGSTAHPIMHPYGYLLHIVSSDQV